MRDICSCIRRAARVRSEEFESFPRPFMRMRKIKASVVKFTTPQLDNSAQLNFIVRKIDDIEKYAADRQEGKRLNSEPGNKYVCTIPPLTVYMIRSTVQFLLFLGLYIIMYSRFKQSHLYRLLYNTRTHMSCSMCLMPLMLLYAILAPHDS